MTAGCARSGKTARDRQLETSPKTGRQCKTARVTAILADLVDDGPGNRTPARRGWPAMARIVRATAKPGPAC